MDEHLRMAIQLAQARSQRDRDQENIRRRRVTEASQTAASEIQQTPHACGNTEPPVYMEFIPESTTDIAPAGALDHDEDFDLIEIESQSGIEPDLDVFDDDQVLDDDEPMTFDDFISFDNGQQVNPLHFYTNVQTLDFCRDLITVIRDANICDAHASRLLKLFSSVLPQPHNLPSSVKALYDSIHGEILLLPT